MDEKRIERLASLLRDSECWEHPGWVYGNEPHHQRDTIDAVIGYGPGDNDTAHAHWHALRAAISEVESGDVTGSETRCAVCGSDVATLDEWPQERTWLCGKHSADWQPCCASLRRARREVRRGDGEVTRDWTIRIIIAARKLYRLEKAKAAPKKAEKCCATCMWTKCIGRPEGHACFSWRRSVVGPNAASKDAEGYLRAQYLERRCVAESLRAVGKWASKTADGAMRSALSWPVITITDDTCCGLSGRWVVYSTTHREGRVELAMEREKVEGKTVMPDTPTLEQRVEALEAHIVSHRRPDGARVIGLSEEVSKLGLRVDALESYANAKRGVGSDKRKGGRGKK